MTTEDDEEEARDRLLFHLENQTGFWFALVVGDDARPRARMREAAEAWCKEHGKAFALHEPAPEELVKLAVELAKGESPGVHWIRADGVNALAESWNAGATQMFLAMNERREAYRERLDGGIIVEGRPALKRIVREMAPDLFTIRAFIADLGDPPEPGALKWRPPLLPGWDASFERPALDELMAAARGARGGSVTGDAMSILLSFSIMEKVTSVISCGLEAQATHDPGLAVHYLTYAADLLRMYPLRSSEGGSTVSRISYVLNHTLAHLYIELKDAHATKHRLRLAGELLDDMPTEPFRFTMQERLVSTCIRAGGIFCEHDNPDDAIQIAREGLRLAEQSASEIPNDNHWKLVVVSARLNLASLLLKQGADRPEALKVFSTAADEISHLGTIEPGMTDMIDLANELRALAADPKSS